MSSRPTAPRALAKITRVLLPNRDRTTIADRSPTAARSPILLRAPIVDRKPELGAWSLTSGSNLPSGIYEPGLERVRVSAMSLVVITGIQAAGKSVVAQALAARLPRSVHLRGDLFRRMIVNGRVDMGPVDPGPEALRQLHLRYELAVDVADRYAAAGFSVVMQDIILGADLARVVDRIRTRPMAVVVLAPRADVVRDRDAERRRRLGKVAYEPGDQDVADLDMVLRTATPRMGLWIDTSDLSVEQTTDQILKQLDSQATVRRQ